MPTSVSAFRKPVIAILLFVALFGCNNGERQPDVSNIKIDLQTRRLDKDLAGLDTSNLATGLQQLHQKYPDFLDFYLDTLMGFDIKGVYDNANPHVSMGLKEFLTYKDYRGLFDTVAKHYPDTRDIDEQLTKGYQYMKYYYPAFQVPHIIYLVSGLRNFAAFTYGNNIVGIGLDMFLGDKYPFYASVGMPAYMNTHLQKSYIPVAVFSAEYEDMHPFNRDDKTLLDMMIQKGKEQYFLKKMLSFIPEYERMGYTQAQLEWCNNSQPEIFNFFIRENLFYSNDWQKIFRYVNDGPNTTGMPPQSPGNIAVYEGYKIVEAYMKEYPQTKLDDLLKESDAEQFLAASKYRPK